MKRSHRVASRRVFEIDGASSPFFSRASRRVCMCVSFDGHYLYDQSHRSLSLRAALHGGYTRRRYEGSARKPSRRHYTRRMEPLRYFIISLTLSRYSSWVGEYYSRCLQHGRSLIRVSINLIEIASMCISSKIAIKRLFLLWRRDQSRERLLDDTNSLSWQLRMLDWGGLYALAAFVRISCSSKTFNLLNRIFRIKKHDYQTSFEFI